MCHMEYIFVHKTDTFNLFLQAKTCALCMLHALLHSNSLHRNPVQKSSAFTRIYTQGFCKIREIKGVEYA